MKKFTLFASMLMAGVSSLFAATDFLAKPELTTDEANPITYCIINYRGDCYTTKGDSTMTAMAAQDYGMASIMTPYIDETAIWYFTDAGDGGVYINNLGIEGTVDGSTAILLDLGEGAPYYLLENGVNNCGLVMSTTDPISSLSCIDAANHSAILSPGWQPSKTDWQGTCWIFVKVDGNDMDAAQEACEAVYREVHPSPEVILAAKINAAIQTALNKVNLYIGISPWTDELFKEFPDRIKAIPTTDTTLEDVQAAIEDVLFDAEDATFEASDIIAENLPGKSFTLQNSRRFGLGRTTTYLGYGERMHYEIEDGDTLSSEMVNIFDCQWLPENEAPYAKCVWTAEETEDGGVYLYNAGSKTYLSWETLGFQEASALILPAESADDAQVFAFEFVDNAYPGIAFYDEAGQGLNVDTRNAALLAPAVYYNYQDGGSTWRIALVDLAGVDSVAADKVVNGEGAVEMFTISGQQVNPATAAPGLYIRRQGDVVTKVLVK